MDLRASWGTIEGVDYPELAARTRRFTYGAPRGITVAADGARVLFLRSAGPEDPADRLWILDVATGAERLVADPAELLGKDSADLPPQERAMRERLRLSAGGIGSYATDAAATMAVFPLAGRLFRADLVRGDVVEVPVVGPAIDPRPDPTGGRIAYVTGGALHVVAANGEDAVLAGEERTGVTWGLAEFIAAEEFGRFRGYWWAPDGRIHPRRPGRRVPGTALAPARPGDRRRTRPPPWRTPGPATANAEVTLHLLDLDGGWVDVHWDRETYPYLVSVELDRGRSADHRAAPAAAARAGAGGRPAYRRDAGARRAGRPALGGAGRRHARATCRTGGCWSAASWPTTGTTRGACSPTAPCSPRPRSTSGGWWARCPAATGPADLLVEASEGEPSEQHLFRVRTAVGASGVEARRLTTAAGWHVGAVGGDVLVIGAASLDHAGTRWTVWRGDVQVATIASLAAAPPYAPRPALERVTDRRLPAAVLYPRSHVTGRRLPVLLDVYGGPGHQEVVAARSAWLERQWWADAGFAVVTIDNRGTPGVAPQLREGDPPAVGRRRSSPTRWTR